MYARLVTGMIASGKLEEAIQLWQEAVAPSVRQQKGFRSARLFVDRKNNKVASMGWWDMEGDVQESEPWNQEQIAKFVGLFVEPPAVGHYEIVAEVMPRDE
jgi:hypothetical protein